jgi:hypothetical protein
MLNKKTLPELYQYHRSVKPTVVSKIAYLGKQYSELERFRYQSNHNNELQSTPYTTAKQRTNNYKWIFFCLGILFFALGGIAYMKTFFLPFSFLPSNSFQILQSLLFEFCIIVSGISIVISFSLCTKKEAISDTSRKAVRNLSQFYNRKQLELGIKMFFYFGVPYRKFLLLNQFYLETRHKIQDLKQETFCLLQKIARAGHLSFQKKEHLYNQAILELNEKLEKQILHFHQTSITCF